MSIEDEERQQQISNHVRVVAMAAHAVSHGQDVPDQILDELFKARAELPKLVPDYRVRNALIFGKMDDLNNPELKSPSQ